MVNLREKHVGPLCPNPVEKSNSLQRLPNPKGCQSFSKALKITGPYGAGNGSGSFNTSAGFAASRG